MKKIITIFSILTSLLVFYTGFTITGTDQHEKISNLYSAIASSENKEVIDVEIMLSESEEDRKDIFQRLITFVKEQGLTACLSDSKQNTNYTRTTIMYIYHEGSLLDYAFFKTKDGQDIDFSNTSNAYFSSSYADLECTDYIEFIDMSYHKSYQDTIEVKQLSSYLQDERIKKQAIYVFFITDNKNDLIDDLQNSNLNDYINYSSIDTFSTAVFDPVNTERLGGFIIVSVMATILLMICQILRNKKEIVIRKMMGMTSLHIFRIMVIPQLSWYILAYLITQLLIYWYFVGNMNKVNRPLWECLSLVFMIYLAFMLIVAMIIWILIANQKSYQEMKKGADSHWVPYIGIVLKTVFIIIIMIPFTTTLANSVPVMETSYILHHYADNMKDYVYVSGVYFDSLSDNKDLLMKQYFADHGGVYQNFNENLNRKMIKEIYPELNIPLYDHPYLIANTNYLRDYTIYTSENLILNLDTLSHNTLLIPEKYGEIDIGMYCDGSCEIITIKDGMKFINHHPFFAFSSTLFKKDPVILVKTELDETMNWNGEYMLLKIDDELSNQKLERYLEENQMKDNVYFENTNMVYEMVLERSNNELLNIVFTMALYFMLMCIFQFQCIYIYFLDHKEQFAINCLLGKNFFQRYVSLITTNICIYLIILVYGYLRGIMMMSTLVLFLFFMMFIDFVILYIMLHSFEKKHVVTILKGE